MWYRELCHSHGIALRLKDGGRDISRLPDSSPRREFGSRVRFAGEQAEQIMMQIKLRLQDLEPDWIPVYWDTNPTLAARLAAAKLGLKMTHVEAGLRSWNRQMPQEMNRVLTDHAHDVLLAPTELATANLQWEGLGERSHLVRDVSTDLLVNCREDLDPRSFRDSLELDGAYVVATAYRASNTGDPEKLARLIEAMVGLPWSWVLVAHPRLIAAAQLWGMPPASWRLEL